MCRVLQIASGLIEVRASGGRGHLFYLTDAKTESPSPVEHIAQLSDALVATVSGPEREQLRSFYHRLFADIMPQSHGTLIAVIPNSHVVPRLFEDGTFLKDQLDMTKEF